MKGKVIWPTLGILLVAGVLWFVLAPAPNDRDQIKSALSKAIKASRQGKTGGVLDFLSSNFKVNDVSYTPTVDVDKVIRQYKPDVEVQNPEPLIKGDTATITSPVRLTMLTRSYDISSVTFSFQKETGTKFLFIPSQDWKMTGASIPPQSYAEFIAQFGISSLN